jgi:hypothetical protein
VEVRGEERGGKRRGEAVRVDDGVWHVKPPGNWGSSTEDLHFSYNIDS